MNRSRTVASFVLIVGLLLALCSEPDSVAKPPQKEKNAVRKPVLLTGRVRARVEHLTGYSINTLGGWLYDVFVFDSDNPEKQGSPPAPIKVVYEFYQYEPALPDKFFDHSKVYELSVYRHAGCDQSVKSLSYETVLEEGKAPRPNYILKVLEGAPTDVLKPDLILPCFLAEAGIIQNR